MVDTEEIVRLTEEYGEAWGLNHTRRLLALVDTLAGDGACDRYVVWIAAHLHDWGAYRPFAQPGVEEMDELLAAFEAGSFGYF